MAKKAVTPGELVDAAIERIEHHNPTLNAVVYQAFDEARSQAAQALPDGPFKGVPFLMNPATRAEALKTITDYINHEQKNPTDAATMTRIMDDSGFFDRSTTKQLMTRPDFRANLDYQVKFFMDQGAMKSAPDLDKAIVTDLL